MSTTKGLIRSVLGQGLAMGWGDEAEAWLRSKLGDEEYDKALQEIRGEYGTFSQESPYLSGIGEFVGGAIPAVGAMFIPGGQGAAPAAAARAVGPLSRLYGLGKPIGERTMKQNVARLGTIGAVQGGVAGAGGSEEEDRTSGAVGGTGIGLTAGVTFPLAGSAIRGFGSRVRDLAGVSPDKAKQWALEKLGMSLDEESPSIIADQIQRDIQMGIPPSVANVTPGTIQLAESVVQRGGKPSRELEELIEAQKSGSRERVGKQVREGLSGKNYYEEEDLLVENLRKNANTAYDTAYAVGDINDPVISRVLQEPEFQKFFTKAQGILDKKRLAAELDPQGDPSKFVLKPIYDPQTGNMVATPDVRTLDYIKQGIDAEINELYKAGKSAEGAALKSLRNQFVQRLDDLVPEYRAARAEYKGDVETLEALRLGRDEFRKMDPEQIQKAITDMSKSEIDAFRTGAARNLFDTIMDPDTDINAARKIIGSPSTRKSLEVMFDTPAQRDFFMSAMERELELFKAAGRILSGSPTAKRQAMRESLESRPGVAEAAAETLSRGFMGSIAQGVLSLIRRGVPDEYYQELADLLKTGSPKDVAAVVKMLEQASATRVAREGRVGIGEAGLVGGSIGAGAGAAPLTEEEQEIARRLGLLQ
jgi:hypothetical protein